MAILRLTLRIGHVVATHDMDMSRKKPNGRVRTLFHINRNFLLAPSPTSEFFRWSSHHRWWFVKKKKTTPIERKKRSSTSRTPLRWPLHCPARGSTVLDCSWTDRRPTIDGVFARRNHWLLRLGASCLCGQHRVGVLRGKHPSIRQTAGRRRAGIVTSSYLSGTFPLSLKKNDKIRTSDWLWF